MANNTQYAVGDKIVLNDIAQAPEGSWVVRETMQFLRAQSGHSIISLTTIEGSPIPVAKTPDKFTLVFAGPPQSEKTSAIAQALNAL